MDFRNKIFKVLIAVFIFLNLITFILGYSLINNEFNENKNVLDQKTQIYLNKEEELFQKLDILANSKKDVNSNIKDLISQIELLKNQLNETSDNFTSINQEKNFYNNKLTELKNTNNLLLQEKQNLEVQLNNQKIQQQQQQQQQKYVVRRTRAS